MVEIRSLTELDREMLRRIITGYVSDAKYAVTWEDSDQKSMIQMELVTLEKPYVKGYEAVDDETFARYQSFVRQGYSLGVYDGGQVVGLAIVERQDWNNSLWIWEFHLAEAYRGKGLGSQLMDALAEKARAAQARVMVCETQTTNVPAIRFYRRMGFALDGIQLSLYSNDDWPDGEIAVFMKRKL